MKIAQLLLFLRIYTKTINEMCIKNSVGNNQFSSIYNIVVYLLYRCLCVCFFFVLYTTICNKRGVFQTTCKMLIEQLYVAMSTTSKHYPFITFSYFIFKIKNIYSITECCFVSNVIYYNSSHHFGTFAKKKLPFHSFYLIIIKTLLHNLNQILCFKH